MRLLHEYNTVEIQLTYSQLYKAHYFICPAWFITGSELFQVKYPPLVWEETQQLAFEKLKDACTSTPILGFADYTGPFVLNTDASIDGLGAVLQQEQDGHTRVIAYASRSLCKSEKN